ncbi:unnamed protein product [Coffea canephora]|uniref:Nucleotide-diphospho-sugar transferase domain-containing protein n=2 Tax=Coffea TaxID=13442 RepID=A0A068TKT8_COFCA|nr:uncharacterized protein At4g15970-like [Coffea arabica]CDO96806.1 unnamed protein product [Coffea canephora]
MDVEDGGITGENDQKPSEPGGYHLLHHQNHRNFSTKSIIKIALLTIAALVACLVLYHSPYHVQYLLPASYNPFPSSSASQESTKANQSSLPSSDQGKSSDAGNLSPPPTDILQGNVPATANNDSTSQANLSPPMTTNNTVQENLPSPDSVENEATKLEKVLSKAAMEDKTVILTTLNAAWTAPNSIFDLFLESFKIGNGTQWLLNHVVVLALDQKAYSHCMEVHPHCYSVTTEGVDFSGEAHFMSQDYLKMMWRRIDFLHTVLKMGYNFIFTDADVMWFRDPLSHFYSDADFQIACDHYWYASTDLNNSPNGGFNYVKSNNRTVQFYKFWYTSKDRFPGQHDQDVLNGIKFDPSINEIGLKIRFLDTAFYGGFCEPSKDLNLVCTMHANCCIGLDNKIHDLRMIIEDWKKYMALPNEEKTVTPQTWTVPRICG